MATAFERQERARMKAKSMDVARIYMQPIRDVWRGMVIVFLAVGLVEVAPTKSLANEPLKKISGACEKDLRSPYDDGCFIPTGSYRRINVPVGLWSEAFCLQTSPAPRMRFVFEGCGVQRYWFHYVDDGPLPERQITAKTTEFLTLDRQVMCGHLSMTEQPCDVVIEARP